MKKSLALGQQKYVISPYCKIEADFFFNFTPPPSPTHKTIYLTPLNFTPLERVDQIHKVWFRPLLLKPIV